MSSDLKSGNNAIEFAISLENFTIRFEKKIKSH